ncbi:hypothetical protein CC1G_09020 [Coprinopsis cinerea okayama7|uniref:Uncharacterized protein n=1 Tax=Coprinopsis cinerea (strain Okayama-7 / 130 / ATCC MYA-4618 / FGSC 9003) TaxID=240176 RepID=A8N9I5_COPC7|nr:hypothetical protein CC1G_09020 [Coprinopsis cinerea okayama7\|eukprot:XP_001831491.2 hypothetical protein CC1G_09020 [Coprinopsis cinerea okayama7\
MRRTLDNIRKRLSVRRTGGENPHQLPQLTPFNLDPQTRFQGIVDTVIQENRRQRMASIEDSDNAIPGPKFTPEELGETIPAAPPLNGTLPLPNELFYLIIETHLFDDTISLLRLSRALPIFQHQCWTQAFSNVPISIRERGSRKKKLTSNVDLFLQLVTHSPRILSYIRGLDIKDCGRHSYRHSLDATSGQDLTTLALLLVLGQRMPRLRSFKIRCSIHWANLPDQLQAAFITLFQNSTIEEVVLCDLALPVNLLGTIPRLKSVDIQTGGVGLPLLHPAAILGPRKKIESLRIRDRNPFGHAASTVGLGSMEWRARPFSLSHLKRLEICLPGNRLSTIQHGLSLCTSLESLKVFVGTAGGLPQSIDLQSLSLLKHLTLSADVSSAVVYEHRFHWLITALTSLSRSVHQALEDLTILMRIDTLLRSRECDWELLDNVFSIDNKDGSNVENKPKVFDADRPNPEEEGTDSGTQNPVAHGLRGTNIRLKPRVEGEDRLARVEESDDEIAPGKWSSLRTVNIIWCTSRREDLREDLNQDFVNELPMLMPNLAERRVVVKAQTTYSDAMYNFWTFT